MKSILIKNAKVITEDDVYRSDLLVEGEKIAGIKKNIGVKADRIIDAEGLYLIPGGIDAHTHMELPLGQICSSDSFVSGSRAALFGGTTTIIDFANQTRGETLASAIKLWEQKSAQIYADFRFHVSVVQADRQTLDEVSQLQKIKKINSFKTFLAYNNMRLNKDELLQVMKRVKEEDGIVLVHCENGDKINQLIHVAKIQKKISPLDHAQARPPEAEVEAVEEVIGLCQQTLCRTYIVHVSTHSALLRLKDAKNQGLPIFAETCPQYLLFDESVYHGEFDKAASFVMSPPIRTQEHVTGLWRELLAGAVDVVATDHCPFMLEQKRLGKSDFTLIPNGAAGVEHRLEILFSEGVIKRGLSLSAWVSLISSNPAKIFGLYPRKGTINVGADADLVLFDPQARHTITKNLHHMNCDRSIYEGIEVVGKCRTVFLRGQTVVDNERFMAEKPFGKWIGY